MKDIRAPSGTSDFNDQERKNRLSGQTQPRVAKREELYTHKKPPYNVTDCFFPRRLEDMMAQSLLVVLTSNQMTVKKPRQRRWKR